MDKLVDAFARQRRTLIIFGSSVALLPIANLAGCSGEKAPPPASPSAANPSPVEAPAPPAAVVEAPTSAAPTPLAAATARPAAIPTVKLEETDPLAAALGYRLDATQVDTAKYKLKARADGATQFCSNCVQYQEIGNPEWGGCVIFAGKLVSAKGWCSTYARKTPSA